MSLKSSDSSLHISYHYSVQTQGILIIGFTDESLFTLQFLQIMSQMIALGSKSHRMSSSKANDMSSGASPKEEKSCPRVAELDRNRYNELKSKTNCVYHETKVTINDNQRDMKSNNNKSPDLDLFVDEEYKQKNNVNNNEESVDDSDVECSDGSQCDCFDCRIRRNSDYSTEQLPLDIQMPLTLMSDSLMLCTLL